MASTAKQVKNAVRSLNVGVNGISPIIQRFEIKLHHNYFANSDCNCSSNRLMNAKFVAAVAAFQAPIIMMSQNRQNARDKHESVIDFAINYKAEQEIEDMQNHLHRIEANGVSNKEQFNDELVQIKQVLTSIEARLAAMQRNSER
ncbi:uncharacterized protein DUF1003 [Paenibacillus taihuensis]|uniref:Uncharacterized protein DUF1003 n=1 Tax=Paenibacillus taihuensis TaxID=1156355 RepID=A0A3D9R0P8_9BACL|nr:DUF1003 domain-containing protein [Paenibacillus taihuensis]REE67587.1 uncharacterized protein DUF1003 [Paenibacillus taihuensis]